MAGFRRSARWLTYPPNAELLRESVKVTRRMQSMSMPSASKVAVRKVAPPGRLLSRNVVQAAGLRAAGDAVRAAKVEQFRTSVTSRSTTPPAVIGIMSDVSGSMSWSTTAVGEAAWLLARGAAHAGARVASVAFGEGVDPIVFPGDVPHKVLIRSAVDGTESPDLALAALDGALGLSSPTINGARVSRVVVILSDMYWTGHQINAFAARSRALAVTGVRFVVIGPVLGTEYSGGRMRLGEKGPDIADTIKSALGFSTPVTRDLWDAEHAKHATHADEIRNHFVGRPTQKWPEQPAKPLTRAEQISSGLKVLPPMTVIYRDLVLRKISQWERSSPQTVRDDIVAITLHALDEMSVKSVEAGAGQ